MNTVINKIDAERIRAIDIARGIAIICIILGHLGNRNINHVVFTFHVPIFFVITGYFVKPTTPTFKYIKRKFQTLIIPYITTSIVIILLAMLKGYIKDGNPIEPAKLWVLASLYGAGDNWNEPFIIKGIGAIWFLWATFFGSIFLKLCLVLKPKYRTFSVLLFFAFGYFTSKLFFWFPLSIQAGCCATLFMYIGYLIQTNKEMLKEISSEAKILVLFLSALVWISFMRNFQSFWLVHCDFGRGFIDILASLCGCLIVIAISKLLDLHLRYVPALLSSIGKNSLFILCVHIVELSLFPWNMLLDKFGWCSSDNIRLLVLILLKVILDVSLGCWLGRIKFVRWVFGQK